MIPIKRDMACGLMLVSRHVEQNLLSVTQQSYHSVFVKGNENICRNKDLHMDVQRASFK